MHLQRRAAHGRGIAIVPAGKPHRRQAGFSLAELMIVLVVMGIMMTIAVPNFTRMGRRDKVESVAYDVHRALALARQKALAKRTPYRVTLDPAGRSFVTERRDAGAWVNDPVDPTVWDADVSLSLECGGSSSNLDILLEPQGTVASADAPVHLTFSNAHGDTARISLVRTGRIRVLL
jgi:type II secretion system protein H